MADKRLAVKVEDHPIEYGDFEGNIPHGNYGAGGVIVWDRGEWVPLEPWREGLEKGKLLFELKGYKLHGKWTLVKIKKSEKEWLLIKERDSYVQSPGDQFPEESVLSGLTVEEIMAGEDPGETIAKALAESAAIRARVDPKKVEPVHCETSDVAFTRDGWLFELKLDGYRLIASKSKGEALLLTRNGNDYTGAFPEIARAVKALPYHDIIIDGEVVVCDEKGIPSFSRLQKRGRLSSAMEIKRAAVELPSTFYAFDLLAFEGFDLRPLPLSERKKFLMEAVPKLGAVRWLDHIDTEGEAFLAQVTAMGLEGIVAKKADSVYTGGRSKNWLKIKAEKTGDFVIAGFTAPKGSRSHIGALQLADLVSGTLVYAGRVGTGFDDDLLKELKSLLDPIVRKDAGSAGPALTPGSEPLKVDAIPDTKTTTWVDPVHVCEVKYREWTPDGFLRHATFVRLRYDKRAHECERQGWSSADPNPPSEPASLDGEDAAKVDGSKAAIVKNIAFTNLKKVFWPADNYTKGHLIDYYKAVSKWMLPYLATRPVVLTRFPDGIDGKSFYQKDAPVFAPDWMRTIPIWSEDTQRDIRYFICDCEEALLYLANMGSIPLHIWASREGSLELPDWCVIDLDPKEAPFSDVIRCAQVLHRVCVSVGLPSYVKTTGKTGLHILLPLGRQCTYEQSRMLGELLARLVIRELGDIATITRHVTKRGDKVYLDYLQNRHGQTIVAPFSVRPLAGATVSMPLLWDEVNSSLDPREFTIKTAMDRLEKLGADPVLPVMDEKPDLAQVLEDLASVWAQQRTTNGAP
jgi:bifunctional non-homologous end joining protein LigD